MPVLLFVNPGSGSEDGLDELRAAAEEQAVTIVELHDDFAVVVDEAFAAHPDLDAAGIAGGDGSLALVAQRCLDRDLPFVCIPFGTRNHFARDVGLDRDDPIGALAAFTDRVERRIDVGFAGERMFLNNVTFGIYAEVVDDEAYRDAKIRTSLRVAREVLRGERDQDHVVVETATGELIESPFAVLVSNNRYDTVSLRTLGTRTRLDEGLLQVWILDAETIGDLASVARAAVGSSTDPEEHPNVESWTTPSLELGSSDGEVAAGIDGEAVTVAMPLTLSVRPAALRVWLPTSG